MSPKYLRQYKSKKTLRDVSFIVTRVKGPSEKQSDEVTSHKYEQAEKNGVIRSMSLKGTLADNAILS